MGGSDSDRASGGSQHRILGLLGLLWHLPERLDVSVLVDWRDRKSYKKTYTRPYLTLVQATIVMCLMLGASVYALRNKHYDLFLVLHILLAIVFLVALFLYVTYRSFGKLS